MSFCHFPTHSHLPALASPLPAQPSIILVPPTPASSCQSSRPAQRLSFKKTVSPSTELLRPTLAKSLSGLVLDSYLSALSRLLLLSLSDRHMRQLTEPQRSQACCPRNASAFPSSPNANKSEPITAFRTLAPVYQRRSPGCCWSFSKMALQTSAISLLSAFRGCESPSHTEVPDSARARRPSSYILSSGAPL